MIKLSVTVEKYLVVLLANIRVGRENHFCQHEYFFEIVHVTSKRTLWKMGECVLKPTLVVSLGGVKE